jgi:hypothetical protein
MMISDEDLALEEKFKQRIMLNTAAESKRLRLNTHDAGAGTWGTTSKSNIGSKQHPQRRLNFLQEINPNSFQQKVVQVAQQS